MTTNGIPITVDGLVLKWAGLTDTQRAKALLELHGKISFRALAKRLNCSESSLRNLVLAGKAPLPDRILASQGRISTRELVRRSEAAAKEKTAAQVGALDRARAKEAQKWCEVICDWIKAEGFSQSYGEQIVDEARRELFEAERAGNLPLGKPPSELSVAEIIKRWKPAHVKADVSEIAWYATWLARWTYFAISDTGTRDRALGLALNRQIVGNSEP